MNTTKLALATAFILWHLSTYAQINTLKPGAAPSASGTERLLAQRHKGLRTAGTSSDKEVYIGVPDLAIATNRAEGELSYSIISHFTFQYDPASNAISSTSSINGATTTVIKNNISSLAVAAGKTGRLSDMNFMELLIRTQNATSSVDVTNLTINGQSINGTYTRANNPGSSYWHLSDFDFGSGFTLTGTITLTGSFGSSTEANKVELTFGSEPAASPLPVLWGDISVRKNVSGNNEVRWTTLQEHHSESFLIQRSEDGRTFQTIGRRSGQGTTTTATHYSFEDLNYKNDAFYRLIQVDEDGGAVYSRIVSVKNKSASSVVYNGADVLFIQSSEKNQRLLRIIDASGRVVSTAIIKDVSSEVDISNLNRGVYFVQLEGMPGTVLRFFKQ